MPESVSRHCPIFMWRRVSWCGSWSESWPPRCPPCGTNAGIGARRRRCCERSLTRRGALSGSGMWRPTGAAPFSGTHRSQNEYEQYVVIVRVLSRDFPRGVYPPFTVKCIQAPAPSSAWEHSSWNFHRRLMILLELTVFFGTTKT